MKTSTACCPSCGSDDPRLHKFAGLPPEGWRCDDDYHGRTKRSSVLSAFALILIFLLLPACSGGALFTYEDENGPMGPTKVKFLPLGGCADPCAEPEPEETPEE